MRSYSKRLDERTLEELRSEIEDQADYIDVKPYSHNIISLILRQISDRFGREAANQAVEDFSLEDLGWSKMPTEAIPQKGKV